MAECRTWGPEGAVGQSPAHGSCQTHSLRVPPTPGPTRGPFCTSVPPHLGPVLMPRGQCPSFGEASLGDAGAPVGISDLGSLPASRLHPGRSRRWCTWRMDPSLSDGSCKQSQHGLVHPHPRGSRGRGGHPRPRVRARDSSGEDTRGLSQAACGPRVQVGKPSPAGPQNGTIFGDRVFMEVLQVK